jgi:hypothetical protein
MKSVSNQFEYVYAEAYGPNTLYFDQCCSSSLS